MGAGSSRISSTYELKNSEGYVPADFFPISGEDFSRVKGVYDDAVMDIFLDADKRDAVVDKLELLESIVEELKKSGVSVETTSGNFSPEIEKKVKSIEELGVSRVELAKVISEVGASNFSTMIHMVYSGETANYSKEQIKIANAFIDLDIGARTVNSLVQAFNKNTSIGKSYLDLIGSSDKETACVNANITLSTLVKLITTNGDSISSINLAGHFNSDLGKVSAFYDRADSSISVIPSVLLSSTYDDYSGSRSTTCWNIGGRFPTSTIAHEFGHFIEDKYFKMGSDKYLSDSAMRCGVSEYGNSNTREAFAEAFSAYCLGITPRQGTQYYSEFTSLMKSKGLQKYKGCLSKPKPSTSVVKNKSNSFNSSGNKISGNIKGHNFSATITKGIRAKGYIVRTIENAQYKIDINTGEFTKV